MSESEIRRLLNKICEDLDRVARKVALPAAVGASLALTGCAGTPKNDVTSDPVETDPVTTVADAGPMAPHLDERVTPSETMPDARPATDYPMPDKTAAVDAGPGVPVRPIRPDSPKPYMGPDAEPLYKSIDKTGLC
jgi:hypothetical protein